MARKVTETKKSSIKVKSAREVGQMIQRHIAYNLHGRHSLSLGKPLQRKLVSYGPWLSILLVLFIIPELFIFAKTGSLMHISNFLDTILFNRSSWVILIILLANLLLLVDGIGELFESKRKGWQRIYLACLLSLGYILWQLADNISQPAAPLLSAVSLLLIIFVLFDIESYYK